MHAPFASGVFSCFAALVLVLSTVAGAAAQVPGCTDLAACNFDPAATEDDGTCEYFSCALLGCTHPAACNFSPTAFFENGTCVFATGCDFCSGGAVIDGDTDHDGICNVNEISGCTAPGACNYNAAATDAAACVFATGCDFCSGGAVVDGDADNDGVCNASEVPGCMNTAACNFNPAATDSNGSCLIASGCDSCAGGAVIDGDADNDGVCNANEVGGCTDANAFNFNPAATDADGSCDYSAALPAAWSFVPTPTSGLVLGTVTLDGFPATADDVVGAFTPAGTCAGTAHCTVYGGTAYVLLPVYGDDPFTPAVEGVGASATFALRLFDASTGEEYVYVTAAGAVALSVWQNMNGAPLPAYTTPGTTLAFSSANPALPCPTPDACGVCNGPGAVYACGCTPLPSGACDCAGNVLDALDVCGGTCPADADGDGICDTADPCIGAFDACGVCNGPGASYTCGCTALPAGACDCAGNVEDALGVCGGPCMADADGDEVCDSADPCIGTLDGCGVCNGPGPVFACGCTALPTGACDCAGNVEDALGVCGGDCPADADHDGLCDDEEIAGCTVPQACNYNPDATLATVPCVFAGYGYICGGGCLVDTDGDGICEQDEVHGCMDPAACNFDPAATESTACLYPDAGRDCADACLADSDGDGICDGDERPGCMNPSSPLFNPYATDPDPSACLYVPTCSDVSGDGFVGTNDLLIMLSQYGYYCP